MEKNYQQEPGKRRVKGRLRVKKNLLGLLQNNGPLSDTELAKMAGLTPARLRRHVDRLEEDGVVDRRGRLNANKIGLHAAIIAIGFASSNIIGPHSEPSDDAAKDFEKWARQAKEVVWWWPLTGPGIDFIFLYVAPSWDDIKHFAYQIYKRKHPNFPPLAYQATYELGPDGYNKHILPLDHLPY